MCSVVMANNTFLQGTSNLCTQCIYVSGVAIACAVSGPAHTKFQIYVEVTILSARINAYHTQSYRSAMNGKFIA
jgi:hypothetical protein